MSMATSLLPRNGTFFKIYVKIVLATYLTWVTLFYAMVARPDYRTKSLKSYTFVLLLSYEARAQIMAHPSSLTILKEARSNYQASY